MNHLLGIRFIFGRRWCTILRGVVGLHDGLSLLEDFGQQTPELGESCLDLENARGERCLGKFRGAADDLFSGAHVPLEVICPESVKREGSSSCSTYELLGLGVELVDAGLGGAVFGQSLDELPQFVATKAVSVEG